MAGDGGARTSVTARTLFDRIVAEGTGREADCGNGNLVVAKAELRSHGLVVVCFDYAREHGSIGTQEARQIVAALHCARTEGRHLVLLLETSGIRVTDETAGIASLRAVLREAMDARLDGVRMIAMVFRCAFGGASMLASVCERRVLHADTLFSMSGPRLITQSVGATCFDAADKLAVLRLLGGTARASVSGDIKVVPAEVQAYLDALMRWLASPPARPPTLSGMRQANERLALRLQTPLCEPAPTSSDAALLDPCARRLLEARHPDGYAAMLADGVVSVRPRRPEPTRILVLATPQATGARATLALARELLRTEEPASSSTLVMVDAESHAATPQDEALVLSEVLAHLALTLRLLHRTGHPVEVAVTGRAGGGIQGALGSGASTVSMDPQARLVVLPRAAMQALNKQEDPGAGTLTIALAVGAVDRALPMTH